MDELAAPLVLLWLGTVRALEGSLSVGAMLALQGLGVAVLARQGAYATLVSSQLENDCEPPRTGQTPADWLDADNQGLEIAS